MLQVQDITVIDARKRWRQLYGWFGQAKLERLGVMPLTRRLDRYRIPIYTGPTPLPVLADVSAEWLVSIEGEPLDAPQQSRLCIGQYPAPMKFGRLELYHWACH
jgi:hypothetical protein